MPKLPPIRLPRPKEPASKGEGGQMVESSFCPKRSKKRRTPAPPNKKPQRQNKQKEVIRYTTNGDRHPLCDVCGDMKCSPLVLSDLGRLLCVPASAASTIINRYAQFTTISLQSLLVASSAIERAMSSYGMGGQGLPRLAI